MLNGVTKVISSPHNIRNVIVMKAQLLQVPLAIENIFSQRRHSGVGDLNLFQS